MSCGRIVEAISARLDGEEPGVAEVVLDSHLARCGSCRAFAASAAGLHRRVRVRPAAQVPDRTGAILAAVAAGPPVTPARVGRRRGVLAGAVAGAAAAVAVGAAVLVGVSGPAPAPGPQVAGSDPLDHAYPGAVVVASPAPEPRVVLTDTAGRPYDLAAATGAAVTVVYFGYTHCPDVCPITMALTARAVRDLPAAQRGQVRVVFVTTDPGRDTPSVLRAWLDRFDPSFVGLTGSPGDVQRAEEQVGMPLSYAEVVTTAATGSYAVVHAGYSLVYSSDGLAHLQVDDSATAASLASTLGHLVAAGYHPDPAGATLPAASGSPDGVRPRG